MPSEKERRFFAEYEVDQNGTQAAIRAGYGPKSAHVTASRLLKRAKDEPEKAKALIAAHRAVEERVSAQVDAAADSAAWVTAKAIRVVEYGTEMTPVIGMFGPIKDPETGDVLLEMRDPKTAVTALTLLARRHAEFKDTAAVDARSLTLVLPDGTSLDDLRALRDGLKA